MNDGELFSGLYLPGLLTPTKSLYYFRDNFLAAPFWQKHGTRLQPKIFNAYNGVVCNSEYLTALAAKVNSNSFFVGQGCDFSCYENTKTNFTQNTRPKIGYVGALNSLRLDLNLLEQLVKNNSQWDWVFVGPEDKEFSSSKLHHFPNAHFTGAKKPSELAKYIARFDVAINPQITNEVTIGNYPRKIDEYLYMGINLPWQQQHQLWKCLLHTVILLQM